MAGINDFIGFTYYRKGGNLIVRGKLCSPDSLFFLIDLLEGEIR